MPAARYRTGAALAGAAAIVMSPLAPSPAFAQSPPQTIRIVVPNPPGGASDMIARLIADHIARNTGRSVVVDNRPGASTAIGTELVARSAPDGGTMAIAVNSLVINSQLRQLPFDPLTSFDAVCELVELPQVLAVHSEGPYKTLADLVADAKARPGQLSLGSNGPNSGQHIVAETFKRRAGVDMNYVPYNGGPPVVNAMLGQQVAAIVVNYPEVSAQVEAGRLRLLAVTSNKRYAALPDTPTFIEQGLDVDLPGWMGLIAAAHTPAPVLKELGAWITAAITSEELRPRLAQLQATPAPVCGAPFHDLLTRQTAVMSAIVKQAGLKAE
jgi:tripartite-type tricarboxylate transporter receptor subunit TctC